MMMLGYEDVNDVSHLKNDPLFKDILEEYSAFKPTISRFENSLDKHSIFKISESWVDNYVASLSGRKNIIKDVDATDDPTLSNHQLPRWYL
jgi:hypothetical protein